jgi:diaminohydroxyphosphoribosylaminopyrimidine deaminase/5-amino-6-(5-phosphoribosylamino)uracil reductase
MHRAIEMAQKGEGLTGNNPLVGCVLVHEGAIVSEGYHHEFGGPHAEVEAVRRLPSNVLARNVTVYVTLEPCAHYGKTPPCAELLRDHGFKKVVIATFDPNPLVAGKGVRILQDAGIEVEVGLLEIEAQKQNRRFWVNQTHKRAYLLAKWAESSNGWMGANEGKVIPISGPESSRLVHQLRAQHPAIMVGVQTWENDRPQLTTRWVNGPNPSIWIIDPQFRGTYPDDRAVHVFTQKKVNDPRAVVLEDFSPKTMLEKLWEQKFTSVLLEGGKRSIEQFWEAEMVDEIVQLVSPKPMAEMENGVTAPKVEFTPTEVMKLGDDVVNRWKR